MNQKKLLLIIAGLLIASSLVFVGTFFGYKQIITGPQGPQGPAGKPVGAISGPDYGGPYFGVNGLQGWVSHGPWINASTTFVDVTNPTGATSTVDMAFLRMTGVATTTINIICGRAEKTANRGLGGMPLQILFYTDAITTSTDADLIGLGRQTWGPSNIGVASATSTSMVFGPNDRFVCKAKSTLENLYDPLPAGYNGVTPAGNTFDGFYNIRWLRDLD